MAFYRWFFQWSTNPTNRYLLEVILSFLVAAGTISMSILIFISIRQNKRNLELIQKGLELKEKEFDYKFKKDFSEALEKLIGGQKSD